MYPLSDAYYRRQRRTLYGTRRFSRKVYSVSRLSKPARLSGFWPGVRSSYRRVRGFKRTRIGLIKSTYTIPEKKYKDTTAFVNNVNESGTIVLLNGLLQGTSTTTRVGQKIKLKSVYLKMLAYGPTQAQQPTLPAIFLRTMIVWDAQPNGTTMVLSDLLEDTSAVPVTISPLNMANTARFKVFYDQTKMLQSQELGTAEIQGAPLVACYDQTFQKMDLEVSYANSNNGSIADIRTGALYLVFVAFTGSNAVNNADVTYYARIRYFDN